MLRARVSVFGFGALLAAVASCSSSDSPDAPGNGQDTNDGPEGRTAGGADASNVDGSSLGSLPVSTLTEDFEQSGTLLRRMLVGIGGAERQFVGWFDKSLGEPCVFASIDITPTMAFVPRSRVYGGSAYRDAACEIPAVVGAGDCSARFHVVADVSAANDPHVYRVTRDGSGPYYRNVAYNGTPTCEIAEKGRNYSLYQQGDEVPRSSLVRKRYDVVRTPDAPLSLGMVQMPETGREVVTIGISDPLGGPTVDCRPVRWKDGTIHCLPDTSRTIWDVFPTQDCSGPSTAVASRTPSLMFIAETPGCGTDWTAHAVTNGPWSPNGLFATSRELGPSSTCKPLSEANYNRPTYVYEVGDEVTAAQLSTIYPPLRHTIGAGVGRLEAHYLEVGALRQLLYWRDTVRGTTCRFNTAADGKYRCLPFDTRSQVVPPVFNPKALGEVDAPSERVVLRYADAECTAPVHVYVSTSCTPPTESVGFDDGCPDSYRAYRVDPTPMPKLWSLAFGTCNEITSAKSYYPTTEIPLDDLAEGTLQVE